MGGEPRLTSCSPVFSRVPAVTVPLDLPERAIVRAVNAERAAVGLPGLRPSRRLSRGAARHSYDLLRNDRLGHASSDGTPFARRVARVGSFRLAGEVIAFAPRGSGARARTVVRMWMRSPYHRRQLLNWRFRVVGIGRMYGALSARRGTVITADLAALR